MSMPCSDEQRFQCQLTQQGFPQPDSWDSQSPGLPVRVEKCTDGADNIAYTPLRVCSLRLLHFAEDIASRLVHLCKASWYQSPCVLYLLFSLRTTKHIMHRISQITLRGMEKSPYYIRALSQNEHSPFVLYIHHHVVGHALTNPDPHSHTACRAPIPNHLSDAAVQGSVEIMHPPPK